MQMSKWFRMSAASCGLSLFLSGAVATAEDDVVWGGKRIQPQPNCPPALIYPPAPVLAPAPAPDAKHPGDLPPSDKTAAPSTTTPTTPTTPGTTPPAPDTTAPGSGLDLSAGGAEAAGAEGTGGGASALGMMGRGDQNARFNLFDNMTAIPRSQVWFGYQILSGYNTGITRVGANDLAQLLQTNPSLVGNPTAIAQTVAQQNRAAFDERIQNLYRVGAEVALSADFSFAFQTQYLANYSTPDKGNSWGTPQILGKYAFVNTPDVVVSATLGVMPQFSVSNDELRERTTRWLPGLLFYKPINDELFVQGGAQFGLASSTRGANTFDYALAAGYWLYRAPDFGTTDAFLTGVVPQMEIFGKNVLANGQSNPFGSFGQVAVPSYSEPRNVYDLTVGSRFLFGQKASLGTGFSFPITGAQVRVAEFIATLNYAF